MIDKAVGGFGEREDLLAGYEAAGGTTLEKLAVDQPQYGAYRREIARSDRG